MTYSIPVAVELRGVRLAMFAARCAYVVCRVVTLTPDESYRAAMFVARRLTRTRVTIGSR